MTDTIHLGLPFIEGSQAQKHIIHNESLRILDALVMLCVKDRDLSAPPVSPAEGDRYIVDPSGSGDFSGHDHAVAHFADGGWSFHAPRTGWLAYVEDEDILVAWDGSAWSPVTSGGGGGGGDLLASQNLSDIAARYTGYDNLSVRGADIASASTLDLEAATGNLVDVTGTTTITAITLSDGHERTVRFTSALTLTHGANLVLPYASDIQTAAGDFAVLRGYAPGVVRCVGYFHASAARAFAAIKQQASDTVTGVVELATDAEARTGADTARVASVSSALAAIRARAQGPSTAMVNGKIVESHVSNAVTYSLKTLAGNDPSAGDPVTIFFLNTAGGFTPREVTGALSITVSAGSTLGAPGTGNPFSIVVGALDNAGDVELWVAQRATRTHAATGSGVLGIYIDETKPVTTTVLAGGGADDSNATIYSVAARSSVHIRALALVDYGNGFSGTVGNWNNGSAPTAIVQIVPGGRRAGIPASFFAHKNNVAQTGLSHLAYTKVTWSTCRHNTGGFFDTANSRWTPPAGLVAMSAMVWWTSNAGVTGGNYVAKIIKNGTIDIAAGIGNWANLADCAQAAVPTFFDLASGNDYYEVYAYSTSKNAANDIGLDGNPAHVWFSGASVGGA